MQFSVNSLLTESQIRYKTPGRSPRPFPCVQNNLHQNHLGHTTTNLPYSENVPRERPVTVCKSFVLLQALRLPLGNVPWRLNFSASFLHSSLDQCPQVMLTVPNLPDPLGSAGMLCLGFPVLFLLKASWMIRQGFLFPGYFQKSLKRQLKISKTSWLF